MKAQRGSSQKAQTSVKGTIRSKGKYWVQAGAKTLASAKGMSRYMQAQRVKWTWSGIKGDSFVVPLTPIQYNEQF